jgi:hypothetical protein
MKVYKMVTAYHAEELSDLVSDYIHDGEWELYGSPLIDSFEDGHVLFQALIKNTIDEPVNKS